MIIVYILIAILIFGVLIFVHELGHFLFAKKFGVAITEFSLGMGPKLISKKGNDGVDYSLRILPIGGFVAMRGEDEESDDPNSFDKKPAWQRFIIVMAGALMNLIVGFIIVFFLTLSKDIYPTTVIAGFSDNSVSNQYLQPGDKIVEIDGTRVHTGSEMSYEITRKGYEPISVTVERNGQKITFDQVSFGTITEQDFVFGRVDFSVFGEEKNFGNVIKHSFFTSKSMVKMVWESLLDLITGRYGVEQVSGPIGVTGAIAEAAKTDAYTLFYMAAVIAINLGIFNLLPIPALDGGTLVFLLIEMISRKRVPKKIEYTIRNIGFALLMALVVFVAFKDVIYLFK